MKQAIPIGVDNYKKIIEKGYYYVDKTLLIQQLLNQKSEVTLFTRPRRFGKTLALSMLRTFFEDERDIEGKHIDNSFYFQDKKIMQAGEEYAAHQGQYPVIAMTLKSAKQPDFEMAYGCLKAAILHEYDRHDYVLIGEALKPKQREQYREIMNGRAEPFQYATALAFLSECLYTYHQKKVIILLDEYDVPLENAYFYHFYEQMGDFIRSLFESSLKTNEYLEFAVITGCLRISRESIFTGLNHLKIDSVLGVDYDGFFGFTEAEVSDMLSFYHLQEKMPEVRKWYDGYRFGNTEVYNPWSVLNYCSDHRADYDALPKPYWSNTSSNSIIRQLVEEADLDTKTEIEALIAGKDITKPIHEDITYDGIHDSQDHLWNFLFFTGYLKKDGESLDGKMIYLDLKIPNQEIGYIYENTILSWFDKKLKKTDRSELYAAVQAGDCEAFADLISEQLMQTISFFDYAESYYHGFLAGILSGMQGYLVQSNREGGLGRSDLYLKPLTRRKPAYVVEVKVAKTFEELEQKAEEALEQIEHGKYVQELYDNGYAKVHWYGIAFFGKDCAVRYRYSEKG